MENSPSQHLQERERDRVEKKGKKHEQAESICISWDVKRETRR